MAAPVASRAFSRHRLRQVVASQAGMGCFDSTAACAALGLSKTAEEQINKVTNSEFEAGSGVYDFRLNLSTTRAHYNVKSAYAPSASVHFASAVAFAVRTLGHGTTMA
jgi:hypothetical protein